ncbi:MAG: RNA methyltransferase [Deltaproteobacteria bacterium]|nr:RNA methyltransferase [Deltaproteobacteria bacterium]
MDCHDEKTGGPRGKTSRFRPDHKLDRRPRTIPRTHIDVILNEPQKPENIGAAARAISNTGLGRLVVVNPRTLNRELMEATATIHAAGILASMSVETSLREALAPYRLVVGTTARAGSRRGPLLSPRQLAPVLLEPSPTALLFGPERMGLSTDDLRLCQKVVRIPTSASAASSLNLAQAVLILGYELLLAAGGEPPPPPAVQGAAQRSINLMYDDLEDTLTGIGFLPADNPGHWLMNIKKIFNRTLLTKGECDLLMGMCRQIRWAVKNLDDVGAGPKKRPDG